MPGSPVEARIEGQNLLDTVMFHDGEMHGITRRELPALQHNLLGSLSDGAVNWQGLINDAQQNIERRLDGVAPIDGNVAVQDLLQHLSIGDQPLAFADQLFQPALRIARG